MRIARNKTSRSRRDAFSLVYLLAVIPLMAVTLLLVMRGIGAVIHAERVIVQRDHECSISQVWLAWLRRDAARSREWHLRCDTATGLSTLTFQTSRGTVTYLVNDAELVRVSEGGDRASWSSGDLSIRLAVRPATAGALLDVFIEYRLKPIEGERALRQCRTSVALGKGYDLAE